MASKKKSVKKKDLPYRPCVGILLFNAQGRVLIARRSDFETNAWQLPQGGIDKGEEPEDAALRELEEETGTANVKILAQSADWLSYDLPSELIGKAWRGRYRGQTQKWFAMLFLGQDSEITPEKVEHPEFDDWKWVDLKDVPEIAIEFKRSIYQSLVEEFSFLPVEIASVFNEKSV